MCTVFLPLVFTMGAHAQVNSGSESEGLMSLSVATYNAGFLDTKILGLKRIYVPDYVSRLSVLPAELKRYADPSTLELCI